MLNSKKLSEVKKGERAFRRFQERLTNEDIEKAFQRIKPLKKGLLTTEEVSLILEDKETFPC